MDSTELVIYILIIVVSTIWGVVLSGWIAPPIVACIAGVFLGTATVFFGLFIFAVVMELVTRLRK
jgi:hypothetical protein